MPQRQSGLVGFNAYILDIGKDGTVFASDLKVYLLQVAVVLTRKSPAEDCLEAQLSGFLVAMRNMLDPEFSLLLHPCQIPLDSFLQKAS